mmetsp:Transcript_18069/g.13015  ORF Transcript_18069/g.13015 Transcript_18069/m.13015 type:complete len:101 (+) Transcript_18069:621-923(+)|eukprot:CAMPEP_0116878672 /NCGR_PEP_ID=MMETSP0463-20121206/10422_1 /TAXON_ID=181622 /ORGANISM="Strombidinopsis sp, Strain SopsisLIS2011" /LENGTH=100 /DNA_ID=CAMNT_0004527127 /DNA_START=548 /DNA_END=850 /DNA_ORIENTATION=+
MPIAFLKNLKYLDYELIDSSERDQATEAFKDEIIEKGNNVADASEEQVHVVDQELIDAHIQCTDDLFYKLCLDEETEKLKHFEKFKELFTQHETMIDEHV